MPKVLVVEDSGSMRAYIRAILEDGATGDAIGAYAVIELIRFVRKSEHHKTTPLLIVSTQHTERDVERGLALGANGYLPKPFTAEQLREMVGTVLKGKASQ